MGRDGRRQGWKGGRGQFVKGLGRLDVKIESVRLGSGKSLMWEEKAVAEGWVGGELLKPRD